MKPFSPPPVLFIHLFPSLMALLLCLSLPGKVFTQAPPCCAPKGCNLNCYGDMEAFASDAEMRQALCAAPANDAEATFEFNLNDQGNTPCVFESPVEVSNVCSGSNIQGVIAPQGNRVLSLLSGGFNNMNKREGVAFPLCGSIQNGQCVIVRFWAAKPPECSGAFTARIEFMANPPVSQAFVYNTPGGVSAITNVTISDNLPNFGLYEVTIQHPGTGDPWNYMLFSLVRTATTRARAIFDDIQVIRPEASFTQSVDCQTATFTSAEDCEDVVSHYWEFGDGTTSIESNPIHFYPLPGDYNVRHTVSLACNTGPLTDLEQQIVTVIACPQEFTCPCENGINIAAGGGLRLSQIGIPGNEWLNQCIAVKGRFIIDKDFTINGGEIIMHPGASIEVQRTNPADPPVTVSILSVNEPSLHGCDDLWSGIIVHPGETLTFYGNTILDAVGAISPLNNSNINVIDNIFDNNYAGIYARNDIQQGFKSINTPFPIIFNRFVTSTSGILIDGSQLGAGIIVDNGFLRVGLENLLPPPFQIPGWNSFEGIRKGISAQNGSLVSIEQSYMELIGKDGVSQSFGITGDNSFVAARKNQIKHCYTGIHTRNQSILIAEGNTIKDIDRAIYAENQSFATLLNDNALEEFDQYGIEIRGTSWLPSTQIQRNSIKGNLALTQLAQDGIHLVDNDGFLLTNTISGNDIDVVYNGLTHSTSNNYRIYDNDIKVNRYGMHLTGSDNLRVKENTMYRDAGSDGTGISTGMGAMNQYCCNIFNHIGGAFRFEGANAAVIRHNEVNDAQGSISCQSGTLLGEQFDAGNFWNGFYATHIGSLAEKQGSRFHVQDGIPSSPELDKIPPYWPQQSVDPQWFVESENMAPNCSGDLSCQTPNFPNLNGTGEELVKQEDINSALQAYSGGDYDEMLNWESARLLLAKIDRRPEILNESSEIQAFYNSMQSAAIKQFHDLEKSVYQARIADSALLISTRALVDSIADRNTAIGQIDVAIVNPECNCDTANLLAEKKLYFDQMFDWFAQIQTNKTTLSNLKLSAVSGLIGTNTSIFAGNLLEQNLKTVNDIYLKSAMSDIYTLTTDQFTDIKTIAEQCPLIGGKSVYTARVLYNLVEARNFDEEDLCSGGEERAQKPTHNKRLNIALYPNPAKDEINLVLGKSMPSVSIHIFSVDGQLIQQIEYENPIPLIPINLNGIVAGIYFCKIYDNSGLVETVRLFILH